MPKLDHHQKLTVRNSNDPSQTQFVTHIKYMGPKLPMRIPLYMLEDEVVCICMHVRVLYQGDCPLVSLVKRLGADIMHILNAILTESRVIFLAYGQPASLVCDAVLASVSMVVPPLLRLIHRAWPYANLSDMSFMETEGYIIGTTNKLFQTREDWWDVLVDLTTGMLDDGTW